MMDYINLVLEYLLNKNSLFYIKGNYFYPAFGFFAGAAILLFAKIISLLVARKENCYQEEAE